VLGKAPIGTFEFLPVISWQVSILPIADQHLTHCLSAFHPLPISKSAFHPLSISKLSFLQICILPKCCQSEIKHFTDSKSVFYPAPISRSAFYPHPETNVMSRF